MTCDPRRVSSTAKATTASRCPGGAFLSARLRGIATAALLAVVTGGWPAIAADLPAGTPAGRAPQQSPDVVGGSDFFTAKGTECYTAFNQPSAQCRDATTYIAYPDESFDPVVVCYDHASQVWSGPVRVGANPLLQQRDSHGNPALVIDRKGFLHVFYGCHAWGMQYARSATPGKWQVVDVGPAIDCGHADFPRDDNFALQVLSLTHLRAYLANITAGVPVKTLVEQWDSHDGGGTWDLTKAIFRSTAYPAKNVLISPKLVADAHPDGAVVFGEAKRYLWGDAGFVTRAQE